MKYNNMGCVNHIDPRVQELIDALLGGLDEQVVKTFLRIKPEEEVYWSIKPPDYRKSTLNYNLGSILLVLSNAWGYSPFVARTGTGDSARTEVQVKMFAPHGLSFAWNVKILRGEEEEDPGITHQWIRLEKSNPGVFFQDVQFR